MRPTQLEQTLAKAKKTEFPLALEQAFSGAPGDVCAETGRFPAIDSAHHRSIMEIEFFRQNPS
ncbi:MAG: hypothetical protein CMI32_08560 [Opitutales bacterium]|nr:hypothetical protein [Opitutales bacterium]